MAGGDVLIENTNEKLKKVNEWANGKKVEVLELKDSVLEYASAFATAGINIIDEKLKPLMPIFTKLEEELANERVMQRDTGLVVIEKERFFDKIVSSVKSFFARFKKSEDKVVSSEIELDTPENVMNEAIMARIIDEEEGRIIPRKSKTRESKDGIIVDEKVYNTNPQTIERREKKLAEIQKRGSGKVKVNEDRSI